MMGMAVPPVYVRVASVDEAVAELARGRFEILAGGTDFYAARADRVISENILDISSISGSRRVEPIVDGWRIGVRVTWTDLMESVLPPSLRLLQQVAREIGGRQVQNAATVLGNVCNASPAADGVPALLALDARVVLKSVRGEREMPLAEFIVGPRRTARAADELLVAIDIPSRSPRATSAFRKLGHRRYLVISVAMVAVVLDFDEAGVVTSAALAVGACSACAQRLARLEERLIGVSLSSLNQGRSFLQALVRPDDLNVLTPIDDVRGTATFRLDAARTVLARTLADALQASPT